MRGGGFFPRWQNKYMCNVHNVRSGVNMRYHFQLNQPTRCSNFTSLLLVV